MSESNSISDWIYVLLTMLAAGLSLLKSNSQKKKNASQARQSTEESWPDYSPEPEEEKNEVADNTNGISAINSGYSFLPEEEGSPILRYEDPAVITSGQESEDVESETNEIDFDLKKAIIYNEILTRKYE